MSKEFLSPIFEPFVRAQDSRAGTAEGSGLGMAIVRHLIDMMGGAFNIESERGLVLIFNTLPIKPPLWNCCITQPPKAVRLI